MSQETLGSGQDTKASILTAAQGVRVLSSCGKFVGGGLALSWAF